MRIIAGEYRGRIIKSPQDAKTRPTSDRLRETLFNILNPRIDESTRFLDLCAGTGAVGIEALSRGAGSSTFVDISRRSCGLIEENLDLLEVEEHRTTVVCMSAEKFLARESDSAWDLVYFDPPYEFDYSVVLSAFGDETKQILAPDGMLVVEHHSKANLPDAVGQIRRWRIVKQGESTLSFFELN